MRRISEVFEVEKKMLLGEKGLIVFVIWTIVTLLGKLGINDLLLAIGVAGLLASAFYFFKLRRKRQELRKERSFVCDDVPVVNIS